MSSAPDSLESAVAWIREQASRLNYGRASIEVVSHGGKITRIITLTENSIAAIPTQNAGVNHDNTR